LKVEVKTEINLPEWANWKVTDLDGTVWIYEKEPKCEGFHHMWWTGQNGNFSLLIRLFRTVDNWKETKVKLK
jgi:hypothetical protein